MPRWTIILTVAATLLICMPIHFRTQSRKGKLPTLLSKIVPTLTAACFAGYAYVTHAGEYALLIFIGLCLSTLADWMLEIKFEIGGVLFFLAHVLYVLAMALYRALSWWCLTVSLIALAAIWFFLSHYAKQISKKHIVLGLTIYSAALAALLGFSLPLPFLAPSQSAYLAALGAALFVASDLTLCHNTIRKMPTIYKYVSLGMYYMGQLMLALSAF